MKLATPGMFLYNGELFNPFLTNVTIWEHIIDRIFLSQITNSKSKNDTRKHFSLIFYSFCCGLLHCLRNFNSIAPPPVILLAEKRLFLKLFFCQSYTFSLLKNGFVTLFLIRFL